MQTSTWHGTSLWGSVRQRKKLGHLFATLIGVLLRDLLIKPCKIHQAVNLWVWAIRIYPHARACNFTMVQQCRGPLSRLIWPIIRWANQWRTKVCVSPVTKTRLGHQPVIIYNPCLLTANALQTSPVLQLTARLTCENLSLWCYQVAGTARNNLTDNSRFTNKIRQRKEKE